MNGYRWLVPISSRIAHLIDWDERKLCHTPPRSITAEMAREPSADTKKCLRCLRKVSNLDD